MKLFKGEKKEKRRRELWLFGYPIKEYLPLLHFFLCYFAANIIIESADKDNIWVLVSVLYLGVSFFLYHYSNITDKEHQDREVARLNKEIRILENIRESDKHTIKMLKKELETNIERSDAIET